MVLLSETEIWAGMRYALAEHRLVLEGGSVVGIGAVLAGKVATDGETVIVCTGANIETRRLRELTEELDASGQAANGEPLVIIAGTPTNDTSFRPTANEFLASLVIGDPQTHPVDPEDWGLAP